MKSVSGVCHCCVRLSVWGGLVLGWCGRAFLWGVGDRCGYDRGSSSEIAVTVAANGFVAWSAEVVIFLLCDGFVGAEWLGA